ncbi:MAG: efflux RND transporter periplasmic adaptor subunit [Deltaproteobacteria bacterium]|nr:efflux RND transporter periplasmic adaptor subunit [Deltaproteobacteria bacterium]
MKIITKITLSLFAVLLILSSCSKENGTAKKVEKKEESVFKVNTAVVIGKSVQRTVEATGNLAPWDEVTISNEIPGTVDRIFVDLGDSVTEGELLLRLDQKDAMANLDAAEAVLETNIRSLERAKAVWQDAGANLKRFTSLFSEGVVSISQRDAVQTQYDVADAQLKQAGALVNQAKAQLEIAKKRLSDTEIKAPISGEIKKRFVSAGEALRDKTPLFILVKNDPLKFQGAVPESFASDIRVGQDVSIHIGAFPNHAFPGKLIRLSPSIDVQTRTISIEAKVSNSGNRLQSGFFAKAIITIKQEKDVPFVPESAVYSFTGINKVYSIENGAASTGIAKERLVKVGSREAGMVEIAEGLKAGEVVATTGLDQLFNGAKVEAK